MARRLRSYFQVHTIQVITDQPLRIILHKLEVLGRLVKWSVELRKFDIEYHPWGAIKGQVIANFIAKYTHMPEGETWAQEEQPGKAKATQVTWILYVDGSSTSKSVGEGVILITPERTKLECAIKFEFKATNNEAEYEALLIELRLSRTLRAKQVRVSRDSHLVVGQVLGENEVRDE